MWMVRDKREYDEPTVLSWIASGRARRSSGGTGYPTLLGAAAISGSSVDQVGISCMYMDAYTHTHAPLVCFTRGVSIGRLFTDFWLKFEHVGLCRLPCPFGRDTLWEFSLLLPHGILHPPTPTTTILCSHLACRQTTR